VRKNGAESAVDKMENTIQNIILQEMEDLNGILIATTNLATNLDSAFERRFLYKIEFEKPDSKVRSRIWQSMVSGLNESDANVLAQAYELSGGQIENIARKDTINRVLYGEGNATDRLTNLMYYCKAETMQSTAKTQRIGFN
jgi:SpoVK/Ycf46/Vps4 family AAA+-type ATPase